MKVLSCAAARRLLHAFHDQELALDDQVAVSAHLGWCEACAESYAELGVIRSMLRSGSAGRLAFAGEDDGGLQRAVVGRVRAERSVGLRVFFEDAVSDHKLMYALCGAGVAALVCVVVTMAMLRFAMSLEQEQLVAEAPHVAAPRSDVYLEPENVYYLAVLGSDQNPILVGDRMRMPRPLDSEFSSSSMLGPDTVFMVAATVTREGRVANPELLPLPEAPKARRGAKASKLAEDLLGAVSKARFEPASMAGLPVAVNMVWMVAHTTVRAKGVLDLPTPKRRRVVFEPIALPRGVPA